MSNNKELLFKSMCHVLSFLESPVIICDSQATILYANYSYVKLAPITPLGRTYWQVFPLCKHVPPYFSNAVTSTKETKDTFTLNSKTFVVRTVPVTKIIPQQIIYMIYFEEITDVIAMEKQIELDETVLANSFFNAIIALSETVETRDPYTAGHQKRTASIALHIAKNANIKAHNLLITLYLGALIHDVGKISVPIEYLTTPKKLESFEFEVVKNHVVNGSRIISKIDCPWNIELIVSQHHERLDGSGYPNGLKGEEIDEMAKIVAIADAWESMVTNRPYRAAWPVKEVIAYFNSTAGILFEKHYVDCLLGLIHREEDICSLEYASLFEIKKILF